MEQTADFVYLVQWHCIQDSYRSRKTGKSQGICVVSERSGKILFMKSQGK